MYLAPDPCIGYQYLSLLLVFNYNRSCHSEMEYKLGTHSQVSIASSYICEVHCSSNCCDFSSDAIWLTTSRVNYTSRLVEMPRPVTCK